MVRVGRKRVADDLGLRRALEALGHVAIFQYAVHCCDVERAVAEGDAARLVQTARQDVDLISLVVAVPIDHGVDLARRSRADEHDAVWARRHLPRVRHVGRVHGDPKARRQGDVAWLGGGAREKSGQGAAKVAADGDQRGEDDEHEREDGGAPHELIVPGVGAGREHLTGLAVLGAVALPVV